MSYILKPRAKTTTPVCETAIQEHIFFILFSFSAINEPKIAVSMPVIFKISKTTGVKFKRGYSLKSKYIPNPSIRGLIIIEKTGFGAFDAR